MVLKLLLLVIIALGFESCTYAVDPEDYDRSCSSPSECRFTTIGHNYCELMTYNLSEAERLTNDRNRLSGDDIAASCRYGPLELGCYGGECVLVDGNCTQEAIEQESCPLKRFQSLESE